MNRFPASTPVIEDIPSALLDSFAVHARLTAAPITQNVIGVDSNDPPTGPTNFAIGAHGAVADSSFMPLPAIPP